MPPFWSNGTSLEVTQGGTWLWSPIWSCLIKGSVFLSVLDFEHVGEVRKSYSCKGAFVILRLGLVGLEVVSSSKGIFVL